MKIISEPIKPRKRRMVNGKRRSLRKITVFGVRLFGRDTSVSFVGILVREPAEPGVISCRVFQSPSGTVESKGAKQ